MTRKLMWFGFFVGSSLGGFLPAIWGGDMLSLSGFMLSMVGGIVGMWIGYRASQSM